MPVPLPTSQSVRLAPPDKDEVQIIARGVASAVAPTGGITAVQRVIIEALFPAMTGFDVDVSTLEPIGAAEFAEALAPRDLAFRTRGVQIMVLCALVLRPLPEEVVDRVSDFARELEADENMIGVARRFADGSYGLASLDFERNGYTADWHADDATSLHTSHQLAAAWDLCVDDPALARRWAALEELPPGTLGRAVTEMYRARGFVYPGLPGSAPPLLCQHDWVHVLANFGTTVESELEVFAFIARASDDMHAFSLLAMVVSLFETGYLRTGAGLFEYSIGHLSSHGEMAVRLADAMRRGALCFDRETGNSSVDYLRLDWFELAALPIEAARERFTVMAKSDGAIAAGSVGPWEPGGISPFQVSSGEALAERQGRAYDCFGASVLPTD
jgi:hypothetical protein